MDGLRLDCKSDTKEERASRRSMYGEMGEAVAKQSGDERDPDEVEQYKKYASEISREHFYMFIDFLSFKDVDFIIAPYEADSQLAYMYHAGEIDYVLTEDSDLVAYGVEHIIRCLKKDGSCQRLDMTKKLGKNEGTTALREFLRMEQEQRTRCCILAGCDYLENIKGLGFGTIVLLFKDDMDYRSKIKEINKRKKILSESDLTSYFNEFDSAYLAFTEQLVFCRKAEKIVNLSAYNNPRKNSICKKLDKTYVGKAIPNETQFVAGELDFEDLSKSRKPCEIDFERLINFFEYRADFSSGRIGNLTSQLITFDNFDKPADYVSQKDLENERKTYKRDISEHKVMGLFKADISAKDTIELSPGKFSASGSESTKRTKM